MHGGAWAHEYLNLINGNTSVRDWWGGEMAAFKDHAVLFWTCALTFSPQKVQKLCKISSWCCNSESQATLRHCLPMASSPIALHCNWHLRYHMLSLGNSKQMSSSEWHARPVNHAHSRAYCKMKHSCPSGAEMVRPCAPAVMWSHQHQNKTGPGTQIAG